METSIKLVSYVIKVMNVSSDLPVTFFFNHRHWLPNVEVTYVPIIDVCMLGYIRI